ncbi:MULTISPECIES: hypothetical protein [unclassified Luteococcus]|uniref:hypothetical protein n=1 Tax=unclassified Luteococcus TaxID=2639923 RepID=UPI00313B31A5
MIALIVAVVALWAVAGFLWVADSKTARPSIDAVLADRSEPITRQEYQEQQAAQAA